MEKKPLMKCGCIASGRDSTGKWVCITHLGLHPGARIVWDENPPEIANRKAKCFYCKKRAPSDFELPWFVCHPEREEDEFYCGCRGWD